jgi:hypothetical protein
VIDSTPPRPHVDQRLGRWLRAVRRATRPEAVGVTPGLRHRHPWLSQVDLARAAGLTPRAYQGVEQGHRRAGPRLLEGVADALRFTDVQRAHLYRLAQPGTARPPSPVELSTARRVVYAHNGPAVAYDELWNVLAANDAFASAVPGLSPGVSQNLLMWFFTATEAQDLFVDWEPMAAQLIARLRTVQAFYADPRPFDQLAGKLAAASPHAGRLWQEGVAVLAEPAITMQRIRTARGVRTVTTVVLQPNGATGPCLRIALSLP